MGKEFPLPWNEKLLTEKGCLLARKGRSPLRKE